MGTRHPLHSICPYFAMFPEHFVERHVSAFTAPGDLVFDPFCGRGTTVFQSLLMRRESIGIDVNPVAACIAGAKADPPSLLQVIERLGDLAEKMSGSRSRTASGEFFRLCFHPATLREIHFLRTSLDWQRDRTDRFIAAMALGALHGESHRSARYLSNRMPRTISTKPDYSVRWWKERKLEPPRRDTFAVLRELARFRFSVDPAPLRGKVIQGDARNAGRQIRKARGKVKLVVTSPPYLNVTDYAEDQWLRLWFLGGSDRPKIRLHKDDRIIDRAAYWQFLQQSWSGLAPLLAPKSHVVIRIGGRLTVDELTEGLRSTLRAGLGGRRLRMKTSPLTSQVSGSQTNSFRPGVGKSFEHDYVFSVT